MENQANNKVGQNMMNQKEISDTIKGLRENQKTALKLLDENVLLKYEMQTLKKTIEEKDNKIDELENEIENWKEKYDDLEKNIEDNYVLRYKDKYEEYGVSERDFY